MEHAPFNVYRRRLKSGIMYYVRYWNPALEKYDSAITTNCRRKTEAILWSQLHLKEQAWMKNRSMTFGEFATDFYDWETSEWVQLKKLTDDIHYTHTYNLALILKNHLLPFFKDYKLSGINETHINRWLISLHSRGFSRLTIKHYLQALRNIMEYAVDQHLISRNPCDRVTKPKIRKRAPKGIFTLEEATQLLDEANIEKLWGSGKTGHRHYTFNLIAAGTGMRTNEIQAMRVGRINFQDKYYENVEAFERHRGFKETKTESSTRFVPLSSKMIKHIQRLLSDTTRPDQLLFPSPYIDGYPIGHTSIGHHFRRACESAKIHDRKRRNITFHSWRHFFLSYLLNRGLNAMLVKNTIGHNTDAMVLNYLKADSAGVAQLRQLQEDQFR